MLQVGGVLNGRPQAGLPKERLGESMLDPFKFTMRLSVLCFVIFGHLVAGLWEAAWYVMHGRRDRVGAAIGDTMRGIVNALGKFLGQ